MEVFWKYIFRYQVSPTYKGEIVFDSLQDEQMFRFYQYIILNERFTSNK